MIMPSSSAHAETIIKNANIITIDPRQPRAQALAIRHGYPLAPVVETGGGLCPRAR